MLMYIYCIPGNISVRFIIANLAWVVYRYIIQHAKAELKSFPTVYDMPILGLFCMDIGSSYTVGKLLISAIQWR